MGVFNLISALLAFIALVLTAVSLATNHWFQFDSDRTAGSSPLNPIRSNSKLTGLTVNYDADHFGLWVGCHRDTTFSKKSCAFIGNQCYSNVCWLRNKKDKTCLDSRFKAITNCAAYQATRVMHIFGTLALILGASLLVVSACVRSKALAASGALLTGIGSFFLMIAFAVFFKEIWKDGSLDSIGKLGWSFILLIVSWPLAFIASLLGCLGAGQTPKNQDAFESEG